MALRNLNHKLRNPNHKAGFVFFWSPGLSSSLFISASSVQVLKKIYSYQTSHDTTAFVMQRIRWIFTSTFLPYFKNEVAETCLQCCSIYADDISTHFLHHSSPILPHFDAVFSVSSCFLRYGVLSYFFSCLGLCKAYFLSPAPPPHTSSSFASSKKILSISSVAEGAVSSGVSDSQSPHALHQDRKDCHTAGIHQ